MEPKYIAVIEIGSATIRGAVGSVDATGGITLLAVEETPAAGSVRYGRVQNAREVSGRADEIVRRLENNPAVAPARITAVYLAVGGRSLASAASEASVNQTDEAEVTPHTIERLHKEARYNLGIDRDVLSIDPRRYMVDNAEVKNPVGAFGRRVSGEFTFITCSPENMRSLKRVSVTSGDRDIEREYITRLPAQADMALTDTDRQLGCLFIDFGAETTTIAVYRDGALPMGSHNITRDLTAGLGITEDSAEHLKLTKGMAVTERANIDAPDAQTREIINYVSARVGEIVANIVHVVTHAGFRPDELKAGIVATGGGSRLAGLMPTLEAQTRMKVRLAAVDRSIRAASPDIHPADAFDLLALIKYAADHAPGRSCLTVPEPAGARAAAAAPQTGVVQPRRTISESDPCLLDDEDLDSPVTVNGDDDTLPEPDEDPNVTRRSLLDRFKNWIAPKVDDNLDDEEDE